MSQFVNQSSVDENIAIYLQNELLEQTISDDVIAWEVQQQYQNNLMCDDVAIALEIQQEEEAYVQSYLHGDEGLARTLQQLEGNLQTSLSDDEKLARYLQQEDQPAYNTYESIQETHQYQPMQVNHSYIPYRDVPSTSTAFSQYDDGENSFGHHQYDDIQTRTHTLSPSTPASEDTADMTYEEMTELGETIGDVSKGLSREMISQLKTHKYGTKARTSCILPWLKKKKKTFVADDSQCSICIVDYEIGDVIITLPCKHIYHKDCISRWLRENRVCCICKAGV